MSKFILFASAVLVLLGLSPIAEAQFRKTYPSVTAAQPVTWLSKFSLTNHGVMVADSNTLLLTTNGGTSWRPLVGAGAPWRKDLAYADIGLDNTILIRTNNGEHYLSTQLGAAGSWSSVGINISFSGNTYRSPVIAVDSRNAVLHNGTTDVYTGIVGYETFIGSYSLQQSSILNLEVTPEKVLFVLSRNFLTSQYNLARLTKVLYSGTNWRQQWTNTVIPSTATVAPAHVAAFDSTTLLCVMTNGEVMRTTNSGATWLSYSVLPVTFSAVVGFAADPNFNKFEIRGTKAILATDNYVYTSIDGGRTWRTSYGIPSHFLGAANTTVRISDTKMFLTINNWMLESSDGGITWNTPFRFMHQFRALEYSPSGQLYGMGGYEIGRSADGGQSFAPIVAPLLPNVYRKAHFITDSSWILVDDTSRIFSTQDAGTTWQRYNLPNRSRSVYPQPISISKSNLGFWSTTPSGFGTSTDGGQNWTFRTNVPTAPYGGAASPGGKYFVFGSGPGLYQSADGATWSSVAGFGNTTPVGLKFKDANIGAMMDDQGFLLHTTNGGTNWTKSTGSLASYLTTAQTFSRKAQIGFGRDTIWVAYEYTVSGLGAHIILAQTVDKGATWRLNWQQPASEVLFATNGRDVPQLAYWKAFGYLYTKGPTTIVYADRALDNGSDQLLVFPNPSSTSLLRLSEQKSGTFILRDLRGQQLRQIDLMQADEVNVGDVLPGLYLWTFRPTNGAPQSGKVVIQ